MMKKRLTAKNDFIFQRIFGRKENADILLSLLNAILNPSATEILTEIEILDNTKLEKDRLDDKLGILDVRAKTKSGFQINIEIQLINQYDMLQRTLFYWSKMYTEQLLSGEPFNRLKKTITINIVDFSFIPLKKYHSSYSLRENEETMFCVTDLIEVHFIELTKFRALNPDLNQALDRWILFLEDTKPEVLEMIREKDPAIAKAEQVLDWLASDAETVRLYELREKNIHDEITRTQGAKEEGLKEGKFKGKKEVAEKMLTKGVALELISEFTGLTLEDLKKLQQP